MAIHRAFRGVTRDLGVSWSESLVIDDFGDDVQRAKARASDLDTSWQMLVESPEWDPEFGIGGFNFLDAIGFRYYLAPAMLRYLKEFPEFDVGLEYVLCHSKLTSDPYRHMQWSLIDDAQAACVRDFLSFMADTCRFLGDEIGSRDWLKALNRYWATRPACSEVSSDRKVKKTWSQRSAIHRKRSATWEPNSDTD